VRRDNSCFSSCKTEWIEPRCVVHVGEALGFLPAIWWMHELNLDPVYFELDFKLVVDSFHYYRKDFMEFGAII
jgi:hypothetical protein